MHHVCKPVFNKLLHQKLRSCLRKVLLNNAVKQSLKGIHVSCQAYSQALGSAEQSINSAAHADEHVCQYTVPPYLDEVTSTGKRVYFETYGCQMNVNDAEYAWAILRSKGYQRTNSSEEADVILLVTCSIREKAEERIWSRLRTLQKLKRSSLTPGYPKIGLLGCMAERLKQEILEREGGVDVIAGPDAYRDLPQLLQESSENSQIAMNVMLSLDETYADIMPVRFEEGSKTAFVSIMRGCDNMCSFCIVPFTRGRERSRPISSILSEVKWLSDQGVKQVTLLGQNVNSYIDLSETHHPTLHQPTTLSKGFKSIYKPKVGGLRFAELLHKVSLVDPEMRIRFTSPHPKDFPDEVLHVLKDRNNICKQVHMPAQSGSSSVLERMRRGYTRGDYLELTRRIKEMMPGVALSTDMISGFCGETEADHEATLSLMRTVRYENAFLFAYSMRKKTHAYHRMYDDVPHHVKKRRLQEVIDCYREILKEVVGRHVGQVQLVMLEGVSKRSDQEMFGKNDQNIKVIIPCKPVPHYNPSLSNPASDGHTVPHPGSYVAVRVLSSSGGSLRGEPICQLTLKDFYNASWDT